MSSFAAAHDFTRHDARRSRLLRQTDAAPARTTQRPWIEVAVTNAGTAFSNGRKRVRPRNAWWLAAVAIALHAGVVWYATHHVSAGVIRPHEAEVTLELVRPPKPVEPPKIEPPKPPPTKPHAQKPQVLPPIQTSVANVAPTDNISAEAPVAIAPIVTAPPAEPPPEKVTAPFGHAGYLNNPPPEYPATAARQGWEGTVLLRVRVLSNGKVEAVEVQKSSGKKLLDDEAARTVKNWSFTPSKRGDTPIDGWATVPIEFKLDQ